MALSPMTTAGVAVVDSWQTLRDSARDSAATSADCEESPTEEKLYDKVGRKVPADRVEDRAAHVAEQLGEYNPKQVVPKPDFRAMRSTGRSADSMQ